LTAALPVTLGHTGHVIVDLVTFLGPVVVVGVLLLIGERRQRRGEKRKEESTEG
jgi:hypothetical protein